jgi:hypothetical protein
LVEVYARLTPEAELTHRLQGIVHRVIVKGVSPKDDKFPDSPWESVVVDYIDLPEATRVRRSKRFHANLPRVSFWELSWDDACFELSSLPVFPKDLRQIERDLQSLKAAPQAQLFIEPVDTWEFVSYLSQVKVPMSMQLLEERLVSGYYRSLKVTSRQAVLSDIELILINSAEFNGSNSQPTRNASWVTKRLVEILELHLRCPSVEYLRLSLPKSVLKSAPGYSFPHNVSEFPPVRYRPLEFTELEGRKKLRKLK